MRYFASRNIAIGATIIGGLFFGLSAKMFNRVFLLLGDSDTVRRYPLHVMGSARPALYQRHPHVSVGFVAAFARVYRRALATRYVSTHDFTVFGWYRIVFGFVVLATAYSGAVDWRCTIHPELNMENHLAIRN
jgi:undecaprenyl-diphosphatase